MDREKYGKIIVDQIINDYKNSKEYKQDAINYIYRWLTCILNYKAAGVGDCFVRDIHGCMEVTEESKKKFMDGMEKYNDLRDKMDTLFKMLYGDTADDLAQAYVSDNRRSQLPHD